VSDFIFEILDSTKDPAVVPLGSSFPARGCFPRQAGRCLASAARHLDPLATVTDLPPGNDELRRQLSLRYLAQGARVSPQEIVITSGAMEGLNLCLQAVTRPGDLIAIESPTFYAGLQASERLGLKVIEIPASARRRQPRGAGGRAAPPSDQGLPVHAQLRQPHRQRWCRTRGGGAGRAARPPRRAADRGRRIRRAALRRHRAPVQQGRRPAGG
jgi:hypothetical protein